MIALVPFLNTLSLALILFLEKNGSFHYLFLKVFFTIFFLFLFLDMCLNLEFIFKSRNLYGYLIMQPQQY